MGAFGNEGSFNLRLIRRDDTWIVPYQTVGVAEGTSRISPRNNQSRPITRTHWGGWGWLLTVGIRNVQWMIA